MHRIKHGWTYAVVTVAGAASLAGCGGGGNGDATAAPPLSVSAVTPTGLTAQLSEDRVTSPVGGTVTYTLTLANNTGHSITYLPVLFAGNAPTPETASSLQILNPLGQSVFSVGNGFDTSSAGPPTTVAPGQTISAPVRGVSVFSAPGRYTATAVFMLKSNASSAAQATTVGPLSLDVQ